MSEYFQGQAEVGTAYAADHFNDVLARLDHEQRRRDILFAKIAIPLTICKVIGTGVLIYMDGGLVKPRDPEAEKAAYSCENFTDELFDPPVGDQYGYRPGATLDGTKITVENMTPRLDPYGDPIMRNDGTAVQEKTIGKLYDKNGQVGGDFNGATNDIVNSWKSILRIDEVRWVTCSLDNGVTLVATDEEELNNAHYNNKDEGVEFTFNAGKPDKLFNETRDLAYTQLHEGGHFIRQKILLGDNEQTKQLVKQMDTLYTQHLTLALEEYRTANFQQILDDLDTLQAQFLALDNSIADNEIKNIIVRGVDYLKHKLSQPGGLAEMAINNLQAPDGTTEVTWSGLSGMLGSAFEATAKEGESRLYGVDEYFEDYPDKLDKNVLHRTNKEIRKFLEGCFLSEGVLPGSSDAHSWEDSNETFATSWILTRVVSPNRYGQVVAGLPEQYRGIALQELEAAKTLRQTLDPDMIQE